MYYLRGRNNANPQTWGTTCRKAKQMSKSVVTYRAVFESKDIPTNDARKALAVQTVVSSNNVITTNLLLKFVSDVKADKAYVKALAFNLSNDDMTLLVNALADAQNAKNKAEKANKALVARQTVTESPVKVLTGNDKIKALQALGISDDVIQALLADDKAKSVKATTKAKPATKVKDDDNDIFTLSIIPTQKGRGRNGKR